MSNTDRSRSWLTALVVGLALVVVVQMAFLLGGFGFARTAFAGSDKSISDAQPQDTQLDNQAVKPAEPLVLRPFDPSSWDPFREMDAMQKHMDALFEQAFGHARGNLGAGLNLSAGGTNAEPAFSPEVDIQDKEGKYVIRLDVPGADGTDLTTSLEDNMLTIQGTRTSSSEQGKAGKVSARSQKTEAFQNSFTLPGPVDPETMTTEYKDGAYTITIDKATPRPQPQ